MASMIVNKAHTDQLPEKPAVSKHLAHFTHTYKAQNSL